MYSQGCEDWWAWQHWFADRTRPGFFLELGALDGVQYSNTLFFEETLGWDGLLIEVDPNNFDMLCCNCRKATAVHAAVCNTSRTVNFVSGGRGATGGILEFMDRAHRDTWISDTGTKAKKKREVKKEPILCAPLRDTFNALNVTHIDFMSLDVEGAEMEVLHSIDWAITTVDVMVVEVAPATARPIRLLLERHGLRHIASDSRNEWYSRRGVDTVRPIRKWGPGLNKACSAQKRVIERNYQVRTRWRFPDKYNDPTCRTKAPAERPCRCFKAAAASGVGPRVNLMQYTGPQDTAPASRRGRRPFAQNSLQDPPTKADA